MRTLYLKNRSNDHSATIIHDNFDQACYLLTGKWGIRNDALSLYTMQGQLLAELKQLSLGLMPKFAIYQNRQRMGTIGKSFGFVREFIYIHGLNWVIVGNAFTNRYRIFRNNHLVFTMEPEQSHLYCRLTINQQSDEPIAILIACVLDHWANKRTPSSLQRRARLWHWNRNSLPQLGCYKTK
ncbi:LURP-one-related/scramblase family protein [uncultured Limosilactobacillus sp.]|uniref:LURP-one-related/scramblase family protein n=1 Tax=uncultured Limosilactobacillus sp. TaxID=2837629 RepID=UPI0025FCED15|nr:hypothetical protein [uncultured Limosilactobacillus sp.]